MSQSEGQSAALGATGEEASGFIEKKPTSEQVKLTEFVTLVSGTGPDSLSEECCEYAAGV